MTGGVGWGSRGQTQNQSPLGITLGLSCYIALLDSYAPPQGPYCLSAHMCIVVGSWSRLGLGNMKPLCTLRSETVVERMLSNWMSICLYQYLKVSSNP